VPQQRPNPGYRPQQVPRPQVPNPPQNRPAQRPDRPSDLTRPGNNPIGIPPSRPPTRPAERPTTLPGTVNRPNIPDRPGAVTRPNLPDRPGNNTRPNVPDRPGGVDRPGITNRPGGSGDRPLPSRPPSRPDRPDRPDWGDRWNPRNDHFDNRRDNWSNSQRDVVRNFENNRVNVWNSLNVNVNTRDWPRRWGTPVFNTWRADVWRFRGGRANEIWFHNTRFHLHDRFFNPFWWGSSWWGPRITIRTGSPWWWWRPAPWRSIRLFFGAALAPTPILFDPGTSVIFVDNTVYVEGRDAGSAEAFRESAIVLANPELDEIPVPAPAENDDAENPTGDWLPLGVWALTQQEQGDATMFVQLSVDKDGIVAGAYKNIMTGDEQPVVGRADLKTQRVAWHIGSATGTVYETGLADLENDVASVFIHFGTGQTQTWLMVRMPSPEMPPEAVRLPTLTETR
jgi:hypothetical protein